MSATDFDALCDGPLSEALAGLEATRSKAVKRFWMTLGIGLVLAVVLALFLPSIEFKLVAFILVLTGAFIFASMPLNKAGRGLKQPVLEAVCSARGVNYTADKF